MIRTARMGIEKRLSNFACSRNPSSKRHSSESNEHHPFSALFFGLACKIRHTPELPMTTLSGGNPMSYHGHMEKGMVIFDEPVWLPDGTKVRVEAVASAATDFWQALSLDELACRQGVPPPQGDEEYLGGWPEDEVNDGFEEAVRHWRRCELEQAL